MVCIKRKLFVQKSSVVAVLAALTTSTLAFAEGNTNVGTNAGTAQTSSAINNTNIGENAGAANTSSDHITNIGFNAGALNTGADNIFIGANAGESNTTGADNTFIGTRAGAVNTATDNTFIGTEAGANNTTGSDNTFIGEEAGESNTDGDDNVFIGEQAGFRNTVGNNNTFIGAATGGSSGSTTPLEEGDSYALTGHNNTAVGEQAGYDLEGNASRNTTVGSAAGHDIGLGLANTMIGSNAGPNTEHADFNTFIGVLAGYDNNRTNNTDDANRNTALGALAGYANREGEDNVWIGAFSNSSNSLFSYNSALETDVESSSSSYWGAGSGNSPGGSTTVYRTTVLGAFAAANDNDSISLGYGAISDNTNSVTIGTNASGKGRYDVTIGDSATNTDTYSVTMGYQASSTHSEAVTIGYQATSHADNTVVLGNANTLTWDPSVDGITALGKGKHCYYDEEGRNATYEWVCDAMYRFADVVSNELSAIANDSQAVEVNLWADNGDDFADQWSLSAADNGNFAIASYVNSTSSSRSETRVKTDLFSLANTGDVTISGGLTLNSDERLKQDIQPIHSALDKLQKIKGVTYHWKKKLGRSETKQYGLIAQNVEQVIPELVQEDETGTKSVNYQALIPVLINATQEQQKQIDEQQKQIALQQEQIQLLLHKLSAK